MKKFISLLVVAFLGAMFVPAVSTASSADVFSLVNTERNQNGVASLRRNAAMDRVAQDWATYLARVGSVGHNDQAKNEIPAGWLGFAENVARVNSTSNAPRRLVDNWMNSAGHRKNITGAYTHTGVGYAVATDGQVYSVQVFALYAREPGSTTPPPTTTPPTTTPPTTVPPTTPAPSPTTPKPTVTTPKPTTVPPTTPAPSPTTPKPTVTTPKPTTSPPTTSAPSPSSSGPTPTTTPSVTPPTGRPATPFIPPARPNNTHSPNSNGGDAINAPAPVVAPGVVVVPAPAVDLVTEDSLGAVYDTVPASASKDRVVRELGVTDLFIDADGYVFVEEGYLADINNSKVKYVDATSLDAIVGFLTEFEDSDSDEATIVTVVGDTDTDPAGTTSPDDGSGGNWSVNRYRLIALVLAGSLASLTVFLRRRSQATANNVTTEE